MKAWRIKENGISLDKMDTQEVLDSCVKIKIAYASVTLTDRLIAQGKLKCEYPLIPGRNAVGMVVETGINVKNCTRGDMVALKPLSSCGECAKCLDSKNVQCENTLAFGITEAGFLSDFSVVSSDNIIKLPERVNSEDAIFIDCIDIAIEAISKMGLEKGEYLAICGADDLGIIMAQAAMYYQIVPILIDMDPSFLQIAGDLGVYYTINSGEEDTKKQVFALTGGKMAHAVAYMSESNYPFNSSLEYVKNGGSIAICGLSDTLKELNVPIGQVHARGLSIFGILESNKNILSAINMLASKTIIIDALIGERIDFNDVDKELKKEILQGSTYLKTLVRMP
ncbi:MAG: alcohol dehydrogenase catalytic domain-containing protein [Firmicutes bacterium]|nr:alcohol dehydrogenase catalytic domain-containing protein [Bacillota bacterium]